jgi:chemotaxis protein MotA
MDLASLIGYALGVGAVVFGIAMGGVGLGAYIDLNSIIIVALGSLGPVFLSNSLSRVLKLPGYFGIVVSDKSYNEPKIITDLVGFAERARREGLLALEDNLEDLSDPFMRKGIQLVVDGTDPEIIKNILYTEVDKLEARHGEGIGMFSYWASMAPAYGMLGTVIGLIAMLANVADTASITRGMAVALITTLYGSFIANAIIGPTGKKLEDKSKLELRSKEIVIEGVLSIQSGDNPRILLEKLVSFLPPSEREAIKAESNQG